MPDPWDVLVEPRKMFVQEKQTLEMPKSAVIRVNQFYFKGKNGLMDGQISQVLEAHLNTY